jgi:hypothetical protein
MLVVHLSNIDLNILLSYNPEILRIWNINVCFIAYSCLLGTMLTSEIESKLAIVRSIPTWSGSPVNAKKNQSINQLPALFTKTTCFMKR